MATDYNIISYTGSKEPVPADYPTERAYAQAYQEWANRRNLALLQSGATTTVYSDDNTNAGTTNNVSVYPVSPNTTSSPTGSVPSPNPGQLTGKKLVDTKFPGVRKDNPLSNLSSYTYALTLYMVTPEAMNSFVMNSGRLNKSFIQQGVYVVAQSGGINNATEMRAITKTGQVGLGQEGLDYYIDDFTVTMAMLGDEQNKGTMNTDFKFKIIEPVGFSFLTDLAKASKSITAASSLAKSDGANEPNRFQQNYIIAIRFYGYKEDGSLVRSSDPLFKDYTNGFTDSNSFIERYYPIRFTNISFRLDNNITTYSCEAYQYSEQTSSGLINGTISKSLNITAGTVGEALSTGVNSLEKNLNQFQLDLKDKNAVNIPISYSFEFEPNSEIASARLIDNDDISSKSLPLSSALTTEQVTARSSLNAKINPTKKALTIQAGTSIITAVDNIIVNSYYIGDSLNQKMSQQAEAEVSKNPGSNKLKWYSMNPVVTIKGRDRKTNNWAYDIKFQINTYDIPYIRSSYAAETSPYPGPYKFYGYWLTGENTEIISYEQEYNNLYFVPDMIGTNANPYQDNRGSTAPSAPQTQVKTNKQGAEQNKGSQINQSVRAQLYSPGDQVEATIKIMGDPDYIMTNVGVNKIFNENSSDFSAEKYYGADMSMSPLNSQTFIQIAFNTASDYQTNGTLDVSSDIQFYETDEVAKAGIQGIVYRVREVTSSFSKGLFTQTLACVLVPSSQLLGKNKTSDDSGRGTGSATAPATPPGYIAPPGSGYSNSPYADVRVNPEDQYEYASYAKAELDAVSDPYSGLAGQAPGIRPTPVSANDDQNLPPIAAPSTIDQAIAVYGANSASEFGTTQGGAALMNTRGGAGEKRVAPSSDSNNLFRRFFGR